MKTINILKTGVLVYALTYIGAYMTNGIFGFATIYAWIVALVSILIGVCVEIYRSQRPTLLKEKYELLQKKYENSQISAQEIETILLRNAEVESELENVKAELDNEKAARKAQEAEVERIENAYSELEAKLDNTKAKLETSEANAKQWAAEKSQAQADFQNTFQTLKESQESHRLIEASTQANLAEAERSLSEIHKFLSEFIAKFGYGIFTRDWEKFKTFWRNPNYSTNRLNAVSSFQTQNEIMLSEASCEIFERHFFSESEVISE